MKRQQGRKRSEKQRSRTEKRRRRKAAERKRIRNRRVENRKRRIERRLGRGLPEDLERPMFRGGNVQYEMAARTRGLAHGGIGLIHEIARESGLIEAIDNNVHVLKLHLPYHESDHVLNVAYNPLSEGRCLEDIELRRNDEVFLDALGTERIPDPTTAGDFCRRFSRHHVRRLMDAVDAARLNVWARQPAEFFEEAVIDMDGTLVETGGACKQGMDISYKGTWGYHPLIVSLANTGEVLSLVNRPGNRPSHEGAAGEADRAVDLCRQGGFGRVLLRGDTDFSQTAHLDRWDADGVKFIFGMDVAPSRHVQADDLPADLWERLERAPRYGVKTKPRRRPANVKEEIVRRREFETIRLESEEIAEFEYRPAKCDRSYRMVVLCKNLTIEKGQRQLFDNYRYFLYITNDRNRSAEEIVFSANDRCNQENLIAQLKGGVRCLHAPVDTLESNWAYMVMTALAWNLKAWWALWLPARPGRWKQKHQDEKQRVLTMEFRTFVNAFVRIPCQIVHMGRRLIYRALAWNRWQPVFFRLADVMRC